MESKRKSVQGGDERSTDSVQVRVSKRSREDRSQELDTLCTVIRGNRFLVELINDPRLRLMLEDLIRKLVKEVFEQLSSRRTFNEVGTSGSKFLELVFKNKLPDTIYTYSKIQSVEIALYDTRSNSIVIDGPQSCMKIKICVLDGNFVCEDWSTDEFNKNIVLPRKNKGQLLKGETVITLKNGVGYITNIQITDNSCWISCRHFMFGAKALNNAAINIKEGRSNPFRVLDTRGQSNLKNFAPSLKDEVCCLKHIPKNGKTHERLRSWGINTVEDLLREHETNPASLQEKIGTSTPRRHREEIIEHAKEAKNAAICVAEAIFDGQIYHSENNTLNSHDREVYKNLNDQIPVETIIQESMKTLTSQAIQHGALDQNLLQFTFSNISQQEEIYGQNWSAGRQYNLGTSNIDESPGQFDEMIKNLQFLCGDDGAEPSNSFLGDPKGKRKLV